MVSCNAMPYINVALRSFLFVGALFGASSRTGAVGRRKDLEVSKVFVQQQKKRNLLPLDFWPLKSFLWMCPTSLQAKLSSAQVTKSASKDLLDLCSLPGHTFNAISLFFSLQDKQNVSSQEKILTVPQKRQCGHKPGISLSHHLSPQICMYTATVAFEGMEGNTTKDDYRT